MPFLVQLEGLKEGRSAPSAGISLGRRRKRQVKTGPKPFWSSHIAQTRAQTVRIISPSRHARWSSRRRRGCCSSAVMDRTYFQIVDDVFRLSVSFRRQKYQTYHRSNNGESITPSQKFLDSWSSDGIVFINTFPYINIM